MLALQFGTLVHRLQSIEGDLEKPVLQDHVGFLRTKGEAPYRAGFRGGGGKRIDERMVVVVVIGQQDVTLFFDREPLKLRSFGFEMRNITINPNRHRAWIRLY